MFSKPLKPTYISAVVNSQEKYCRVIDQVIDDPEQLYRLSFWIKNEQQHSWCAVLPEPRSYLNHSLNSKYNLIMVPTPPIPPNRITIIPRSQFGDTNKDLNHKV